MRRAVGAVCAALVVVLVAAGCSAGQSHADPMPTVQETAFPGAVKDQLSKAVTAAMGATGSSGAIVGVWAPWSGAWVAGVGTVARGDKTPVDPQMTYRAGDITRPMTCDVLYALAAKGTVALDDSVTKYVDGVPKLTKVTLQELCDGTSGIGSYDAALTPMVLSNPARVWDPNELAGYGLGQVDNDVRSGVAYRDSDAGYVLLGLALERATGQTAASLLREYVTRPLGLTATDLPGDTSADPVVGTSTALPGSYLGDKASDGSYRCDRPTDITDQSASFGFTDSGVVSDIRDVGTYVRALASGALVSTKGRFSDALPAGHDLPTWFTAAGGAVRLGTLVGQYSARPGYLTAAFSDPKSGLTVAVVLNDSTAGANAVLSLAQELAAIASKAPAAHGKTAPALGLPWTAQAAHDAVAALAVCHPAS